MSASLIIALIACIGLLDFGRVLADSIRAYIIKRRLQRSVWLVEIKRDAPIHSYRGSNR